MIIRVITPPEPLVSWEEARAHLRLDDDDFEQSYVETLIAAASAWIDGPDGWLGRCLGLQTIEVRAASFGYSEITLPIGPISAAALATVTYLDEDAVERTLDNAVYEVLPPRSIRLRTEQEWPVVAEHPEAVRIRFEAGYAEVPAAVKQAVLLIVGHWFRTRETVIVGTISSTLPLGAEALLSTYRSW